MVEEDELPIPIKYPNGTRKSTASGSPRPAPGLHVAELFGTNRRRGERRVSGAFKY